MQIPKEKQETNQRDRRHDQNPPTHDHPNGHPYRLPQFPLAVSSSQLGWGNLWTNQELLHG